MRKSASITPIILFIILFFMLSACTLNPQLAPENTNTPSNSEQTNQPSLPTTELAIASSPSPTITPKPTSAVIVDAAKLNGQTVSFWHIWDGDRGKLIKDLVNEFNTSNQWEIIVIPRFVGTYDDIDHNLKKRVDDTEIPDVLIGYLHQAQVWDKDFGLVDLNTYYADPDWGFSEDFRAEAISIFWEYDLSNGKRLGLPIEGNAQLIYYNASWANELGFTAPPQTPEELREQACKASQANLNDENPDNDQTGGLILDTNYATMLSWIYAFGGDILLEQESTASESIYQFNTPEVTKAFYFLRELYDQGCATYAEEISPSEALASRQGLFITDSALGILYQAADMRNNHNPDYWTVLPFPSPKQKPAIDVFAPALEITQSNPEKQLAAWLFIKWLLQPEQQARLIKTSNALPLDLTTASLLGDFKNTHTQWGAAFDLLPYGKQEPQDPSWSNVRWALRDAYTQLFKFYFTIDQIPDLVNYLDQIAYELYLGAEKSGIYNTPTFTPSPTYTPTITPTPSATPTITKTPRFTYTPTP